MKLIEYFPLFLQDNREFKIISNIEDVELEKIKAKIEEILKEVIVSNAENYGLKRYEKIYNIENSSNDLIVRRYNILAKINNRVPYTMNWLRNKLNNTIGEENYRISIDYDKKILEIEILAIFKEIATVLYKDLREQLPANLQIAVNLFQIEQCNQYIGGIVHTGEILKLRQVI